jgi:ATP-dependent DNA ligase
MAPQYGAGSCSCFSWWCGSIELRFRHSDLCSPTGLSWLQRAVALAFDLMSLDGEDFRQEPFSERKAVLRKVLRRTRRGIQYVEHTEGDGGEMFKAVCKLGLEGIVSKKVDAPYRSGPSKTWIKVKNPKSPAATRAIDGTF